MEVRPYGQLQQQHQDQPALQQEAIAGMHPVGDLEAQVGGHVGERHWIHMRPRFTTDVKQRGVAPATHLERAAAGQARVSKRTGAAGVAGR